MANALITGASRGFGLALAEAFRDRGWRLLIDARDESTLARAVERLGRDNDVTAIAGDVSDPAHRARLAAVVDTWGSLDLLINNASVLGPSPQPELASYPANALGYVFRVNTFAPLGLIQDLLPHLLRERGTIVNITSDAAVEAYEGWGGYGSSKAALEHITATLAVEQPGLRVYSFDPGDMRTEMHQRAFPDEDISDRPEPATVVPALLRLIDERPVSGRYRASEFDVEEQGVSA